MYIPQYMGVIEPHLDADFTTNLPWLIIAAKLHLPSVNHDLVCQSGLAHDPQRPEHHPPLQYYGTRHQASQSLLQQANCTLSCP